MANPKVRPASKSKPSPRRRWIRLGILTSPIWLGFGLLFYTQHAMNLRVFKAIQEADRDSLDWRLKDLEATRNRMSLEQNSAMRVQAILGTLDRGRGSERNEEDAIEEPIGGVKSREIGSSLAELSPDEPIPPILLFGLRRELKIDAKAIVETRLLADMGEGYYPLKYSPVWIATLLNHVQNTRRVATIIQYDAIARAEAGDGDGAIESCRSLLGLARSIGDEPIVISQLVRMAYDQLAVTKLERVLARSVPSEAALAKLQADLAREEKIPFVLIGVRGERAGMFDLMEKIADGSIPTTSLKGLTGTDADAYLAYPMQINAFNRYNEGLLLEYMNRGVAIARKPFRDQPALWDAWERETRPSGGLSSYLGILAQSLKANLKGGALAQLRTVSGLRISQLVVARERFRLVHGRWPGSLNELVPEFLDALPADPYIDAPLHARTLDDGLIVYSVDLDGKDNGGTKATKRFQADFDQVFRVWNLEHRGRSTPELPSNPFVSTATPGPNKIEPSP